MKKSQKHSYSCRDKIEMAWRHKSRDEKILIRIIAGLCVCLVAFITTVAILDITYKHEIKDLKEEINRLKESKSTESSTDITEGTEVTESILPTIPPEPSTTTTAGAPTSAPKTHVVTTSVAGEISSLVLEPTPESSSSKDVHIEAALIGSLLLQALQSIMNIDDRNSSNTLIEEFNNGRTKATVVLMANLEHQPPTKIPQTVHPTTELLENSMSVSTQQAEELQHQYASLEPTSEVPLTTSSSSWWPFTYQNTPTESTTINPHTIHVDTDQSKRRTIRHRKRKISKQKIKKEE